MGRRNLGSFDVRPLPFAVRSGSLLVVVLRFLRFGATEVLAWSDVGAAVRRPLLAGAWEDRWSVKQQPSISNIDLALVCTVWNWVGSAGSCNGTRPHKVNGTGLKHESQVSHAPLGTQRLVLSQLRPV
jgi:hypothetical protein